jgi:outer membrane protein OmpA-like peptidoglycan-associated protein
MKPLEPGAPLDLAEARNAVELSRLAGADRYAADSFAKAESLLNDAEVARGRHKHGNEVMMPARQAAQTAEDARIIALQRQQEAFQAQQQALVAQQEHDAEVRAQVERERAEAEQTKRRQAELDAQNAAAARTAAEAARQAADAQSRLAQAQLQQAQLQADQARAAAVQAEQEKTALRERLRQQLSLVLETRETARGLIVNVSDVLFDTASATLKPGAREKLARVAGILATQPDIKIEVEGHTDSVGNDDYNQRLSERRAESVRSYLVQQRIPPTAVEAVGFGESRPVASNDTSAGRQQNRRVELVVTGESIGRTSTGAPSN